MRSGLVGEAEPLKKFGVNINAARIEAEALALGLLSADGTMTDAAKTQATYSLIMKDTALAQGDFARTSDGLANQQRILSAKFGDLQAKIGTALLPVITEVVSFLAGPGIEAFDSLTGVVGQVAGVIGDVLAPAIGFVQENAGPVVETMSALAAVLGDALGPVIEFVSEQIGELVTFFVDNFDQMRQAVENALTAIAVVVGIVLAPLVIFFRSWGDEILEIVKVVWEQIQNTISTAVDLIKGIITLVMALLTGDWDKAWQALVDIVLTAWDYITETVENSLQIIWQLVQGVLGGLIDLWRTGWQLFFDIVNNAISAIPGLIRTVLEEVVQFIAGIPGRIVDLAQAYPNAGTSIASALVNGIKSALGSAVGIAGDFARAIKNAINNIVLRPLREALSFTIDLPGPLGSFTVNGGSLIPLLAAGGITTGPTLGVLGEAGREAVLPLPPGLLEGLHALAKDRLSGGGQAGDFTYAPTLIFPGVVDRSEADAVTERVNANLAAAAQTRAGAVAVRR
jgi:hypothetical protein